MIKLESNKAYFFKIVNNYGKRLIDLCLYIWYSTVSIRRYIKFIKESCMETSRFDGIIFDVDGTLWDARGVVAKSWEDIIRRETDWPIRFDDKSLGAMFGRTMDTIFFHFYPESTREEYERLTAIIYNVQNENLIKYAPPLYDGVKETLKKLSERYRLFIVTNAQRGYIDTIFKVHDIRKYFTDWMCFGDTGESKDVTITRLMERNHLERAVYVGDTQGDADASAKAGIPMVYAGYGLGSVDKPWKSIESFRELGDIFLKNIICENDKAEGRIKEHGYVVLSNDLEGAGEKVDTVIFDLDGTLLYTIEDLAGSVNYVLKKHGMPERSLEEITSFVGNGVAKLMERAAVSGTSLEQTAELLAEFKEHYGAHSMDNTRPYDGITDMLKNLKRRGFKLAVVSNKLESATENLCGHFFPGLIDTVVGDNPRMAKKPEADMVNAALFRLKSSRAAAVYVGDSEVDIATAANAGMRLIMVEWGFRKRADMEVLGAQSFIRKPDEIYSVLDRQSAL